MKRAELQLGEQRRVRSQLRDGRASAQLAPAHERRGVQRLRRAGVELDPAPPQAHGDRLGARLALGEPLGGLGEQLRRTFEPSRRRVERTDERPQPTEQDRLPRGQGSRDADAMKDGGHAGKRSRAVTPPQFDGPVAEEGRARLSTLKVAENSEPSVSTDIRPL